MSKNSYSIINYKEANDGFLNEFVKTIGLRGLRIVQVLPITTTTRVTEAAILVEGKPNDCDKEECIYYHV